MKARSETLMQRRSIAAGPISRRACLPLIAAAVLSSATVISARAQGQRWQTFRRADAGFEIEMPGEPRVWQDDTSDAARRRGLRPDDNWVRTIEAGVEYQRISFDIHYVEYLRVPSMDVLSRAARGRLSRPALRGRTAHGSSLLRETPLAVYGVPATEFVSERLGVIGIERIAILSKGVISISIHGDNGRSPLVQRFFDSFKVLSAN